MNEPKERPILFSSEMVRAILAGRKTQTRRVVSEAQMRRMEAETLKYAKCDYHTGPYGKPGDRLWVREAWMYVGPGSGSSLPIDLAEITLPENQRTENVWYRATPKYEDTLTWIWKPSIFMPRWASRITLEVVSVRVERLQAITCEDLKAEGAEGLPREGVLSRRNDCHDTMQAFRELWDTINAKRGHSWESNPWVWVVEFRKVTP